MDSKIAAFEGDIIEEGTQGVGAAGVEATELGIFKEPSICGRDVVEEEGEGDEEKEDEEEDEE